ncbi:MAG: sigma-70 family RNA polymerase sigma factor [Intrasporangium sp.]|uniref:sigma-70 family RNA polymerase sigma factor n=1 Tax=Intrasporangium sp. TaxID=1925024 RepID=UPI002655BEC6|nr:sigma-70 family RNA polymerase sigma factor [Intrasporangium sp.]
MEQGDAPASLGDLAVRAVHDRRAAELLLGRVRDLALKYARVRLGRFGAEDAAQDVAQEVCMAVLSALPTYEHRGLPFEAFAYRVAARKLADAQRAVMRTPTPVAELPDAVDDDPGPEDRAVTRAEARIALELMEQLPVQQREILTLRVAVGLSTEETAASLGMTSGAVRVAQHRALTKLRGLMATRTASEVA